MDCSVCKKPFDVTDKVVPASCGHLVHCFKSNCIASDHCTICDQDFKIFANTPLVKLNFKDKDLTDPEKSVKTLKMPEPMDVRPKIVVRKRQLDDEFIKKQFEIQREITSHLISKLKLTEDMVTIVKEQQAEMLKIIEVVTQLQLGLAIMKEEIADLQDQVFENSEVRDSEDSCSCPDRQDCDHVPDDIKRVDA